MNWIVNRTLVEEIRISNEIEGVVSTRKEINELMSKKNPNKYKRLYGMVNKYRQLIRDNEELVINSSNDIRHLYNKTMLMDVKKDYRGKYIEVLGQFRSYNRHESSRNRLVLSVFAREISLCEEEQNCIKPNHIYLDGYICKNPVYRKTPLGREIADLLVAVNRPYGKSDYIPCICWGRNARYAEKFQVGEHIQLWGRIQSREYQKKISEREVEKRVAYEVSASNLIILSQSGK